MSTTPPQFTVFRRSQSILGESLVAQTRDGEHVMLWCDITRGLLHSSPVDGPTDGSGDTTIAMPAPLCSFHPSMVDGQEGFVMSLEDSVVLTDRQGQILETLARIDHARPGTRMNEGKADPRGRWVSGSMDPDKEPTGAFYGITQDGDVRLLAEHIGVANGLEFSDDGTRIFFTDTSAETIYAGDYSPDGEVSNVEKFISGGSHDGLTMDVDGGFWSAIYGGGRVIHYDATGTEEFHIDLPAPNLTSVAFGGPGLTTLYVTSARENLNEQQLAAHPLSGSVFAIGTATSGRPPRVFGRT